MKTYSPLLFILLYALSVRSNAQISYAFEYKIEGLKTSLKKSETTSEDLGWISIKSNSDRVQVIKRDKKHAYFNENYILDFKNRVEITYSADSSRYVLEDIDSACGFTDRIFTETNTDDVINGQPCYAYESQGLLKEKIWVNKKIKNNPAISKAIFGSIILYGGELLTQPITGRIEKIELSYENGKSIRKEIYTLSTSSDQPVESIKLPWLDDTKRPAIRCTSSGESALIKGLILYDPPAGMSRGNFDRYMDRMQALYLRVTGHQVNMFACMPRSYGLDLYRNRTEVESRVILR